MTISRPVTIVELDMDRCTRVYGISPCTAGRVQSGTAQAGAATTITLAADASAVNDAYKNMTVYIVSGTGLGQEKKITGYVGSTKVATVESAWTTIPDATSVYNVINRPFACYNTRVTCQDQANFVSAIQIYRLSDTGIGIPPSVGAIPCIQSVSSASTKLTPMKGLGQRANMSVSFSDFAHHDRVYDPYVSSRLYSAEDVGTFWGKFRARHQYYQGRKMRVRTGTITDPWDWNLFRNRTYIIERMTGPDKSGKVTITGKDVLKLADDDRAQCPIASTSTLSVGINASVTSLTLLPAGIGASEYAVREQIVGQGAVRISSEIMTYTRAGDVLTITRGQWGTTAAAHNAESAIQLCASWSAVNVATVIKQLLGPLFAKVDFANVGTSYLSHASWADEATGNLSSYGITGIVSKPEGVNKIIAELCEQCMAMVWWDEVNQLIKIKGIAPELTVNSFNDDSHLIAESTQAADDPAQRVSQMWMFYGKIDYTGDDKPENFRFLYVQADLNAEGVQQYGEQRIKSIKSRWLTSSAPIIKTASRALIFLRDNVRSLKFSMDSKDRALDIADSTVITTDAFQDAAGAPLPLGMVITERTEKGGRVEYAALNMGFFGRYARIAPGGDNSSGTHTPSTFSATIASYATATAEEKRKYGYIIAGGDNSSGTHVPAASTTKFADGGDAYKVA